MSAQFLPLLKPTFYDANGNLLANGKVYSYISGTTTLTDTFTTTEGDVPNTNPVILDISGQADIFLAAGQQYKLIITDENDVTIDTIDPVFGGGSGGGGGVGYNIRNYGAIGDGVADDTQAILDAMEAASTDQTVIYVPPGTYKITSSITNAGARANCMGIVGDTSKSCIFDGATLTGDAFVFTDIPKASRFEHFSIFGPGQDSVLTSSGLQFLLVAGANVYGQVMTDVRVERFPTKGFYWQIPITTVFDQLVAQEIGDQGFVVGPKPGPSTFVGGTSTTWAGCYANNVDGDGFYLNAHGYASMSGCAVDNAVTSYHFYRSFNIAFNGCGSEVQTYVSALLPGDAIVIDECYAVAITGLWTYNMPNVASRQVRITDSTHVTIQGVAGYTDNGISPAYNCEVNAGCNSVVFINNSPTLNETGLVSPTFTINNLGLNTINIADGNVEGIQFETPDIYGNSLYVRNGAFVVSADPGAGAVNLFQTLLVDYPTVSITNDGTIALGSGSIAADTVIQRAGAGLLSASPFDGIQIEGASNPGLQLTNTSDNQVWGITADNSTGVALYDATNAQTTAYFWPKNGVVGQDGKIEAYYDLSVGGDADIEGDVTIGSLGLSNATAIGNPQVALTGWSTSTINYVSGNNAAGSIGINAAGTPSANPTIKVTYLAPIPARYSFIPSLIITSYQAVAAGTGNWQVVEQTATYFTVAYIGTPVSGFTYGFNYLVITP